MIGIRGAALLLAALTPLTAVTTPSSADALVDTDPPAVGSCHNLTYEEIRGVSSDKPPVPCSSRHTTLTFDVVEFAEPPDWNDEDTYEGDVFAQCNLSWIDVLGNPEIDHSVQLHLLLAAPDARPARRRGGLGAVRARAPRGEIGSTVARERAARPGAAGSSRRSVPRGEPDRLPLHRLRAPAPVPREPLDPAPGGSLAGRGPGPGARPGGMPAAGVAGLPLLMAVFAVLVEAGFPIRDLLHEVPG